MEMEKSAGEPVDLVAAVRRAALVIEFVDPCNAMMLSNLARILRFCRGEQHFFYFLERTVISLHKLIFSFLSPLSYSGKDASCTYPNILHIELF